MIRSHGTISLNCRVSNRNERIEYQVIDMDVQPIIGAATAVHL